MAQLRPVRAATYSSFFSVWSKDKTKVSTSFMFGPLPSGIAGTIGMNGNGLMSF